MHGEPQSVSTQDGGGPPPSTHWYTAAICAAIEAQVKRGARAPAARAHLPALGSDSANSRRRPAAMPAWVGADR